MEVNESNHLFPFKDIKIPVDPILEYNKEKYGDTLVIENGKYICKLKFLLRNRYLEKWPPKVKGTSK